MKGLMMDYPLTLRHILERAYRFYPRKEIATKVGTTMHRYNYAGLYERVGRLANALARLGVRRGDRVATLGWNTYRHLELYYAVPCMNGVLHTLNLRLPSSQLSYIINHAEDRVICVDQTLLPILEKIAPELRCVEQVIVMTDDGLAETSIPRVLSYEELLSGESPDYSWPQIEENEAAAMCYTSGTTGEPKGVLYSHRAVFLHAMAEGMADAFALSERDVVMPVVPMFHVMAWGLPFSAALVGAGQVFPGPHLTPRDLAELIQAERVTLTAGVPTIWLGLLNLLERERYDLSSLRLMPVGGAAAPRAMIEQFEKKYGIRVLHAWGMTETTPLGTAAGLKSHMFEWDEERQYEVRSRQGMTIPGVEFRGVDEAGKEIAWDGQAKGELQVRGPWVIAEYYRDPSTAEAFVNGWFRTGDVVTIDPDGYMQIVDRVKDLVKSGGEWISSVALENAIMAHPKVAEAAVIAVPHPRWQERPLAAVVPKADLAEPLSKEEIYDLLREKFAKWELPDDIVFIEAVPKTSVGKFDKKVLRAQMADYRLPGI